MVRSLLTSLALTGVLAMGVGSTPFAQQSTTEKEDAKKAGKQIKQAGKDAKDAAEDVGDAAKDAGKAAAKTAKKTGKAVKRAVTPNTTTALCKDGTVQSGKTKTTACFDHGGVK